MKRIHADRARGSITIGREGENDVTALVFDDSIAQWQAEHGPGTVTLLMQRQGDASPYPVTLEISGTEAVWHVSAVDTAVPGYARCQLSYLVDDKIAKSRKYVLFVEDSLGTAGPVPPSPDPGGTAYLIGDGLKVTPTPEGQILSVDTVDHVEDNTRPITAAAVYTAVGNVEALLSTI